MQMAKRLQVERARGELVVGINWNWYTLTVMLTAGDGALAVKVEIAAPVVAPVRSEQRANGSPIEMKGDPEWTYSSMKADQKPHRRPKAPKPFDPSPSSDSPAKKRRVRCMECPACLRLDDCGVCSNCRWAGLGTAVGGAGRVCC